MIAEKVTEEFSLIFWGFWDWIVWILGLIC